MSSTPTVEELSEELGLGLELIEMICAQSDEPVTYLDDPIGPRAYERLTALAGRVRHTAEADSGDGISDSNESSAPPRNEENESADASVDRHQTETNGAVKSEQDPVEGAPLTLRGEAPRPDRHAHLDHAASEVDWSLTTSLDDRTKGPGLKILMGLVILSVLGFLAVVAWSTSEPEPNDAQATSDPYVAGACVSGPLGSTASSTQLTPCFGPHTAEILLVVIDDRSQAPYPGIGSLTVSNYDPCAEAFDRHTGTTLSATDKTLGFYLPSEASWNAGDRRLLCVATGPGDELTAPLSP